MFCLISDLKFTLPDVTSFLPDNLPRLQKKIKPDNITSEIWRRSRSCIHYTASCHEFSQYFTDPKVIDPKITFDVIYHVFLSEEEKYSYNIDHKFIIIMEN